MSILTGIKKHKGKIALSAVFIVSACVILVLWPKNESKQSQASSKTDQNMPCMQLTSCVSGIKTYLIRKIITRKWERVDLDKTIELDLSFPDSPDFQNDPQKSVFYVEDFYGRDLLDKSIHNLRKMTQELSHSSGPILSVSNRISGLGTEAPELLAIIPDVREDICQRIIRKIENIHSSKDVITIPNLDEKPNLLPHPEIVDEDKIVTIPNFGAPYGCVQAKNKFYYYQVILQM